MKTPKHTIHLTTTFSQGPYQKNKPIEVSFDNSEGNNPSDFWRGVAAMTGAFLSPSFPMLKKVQQEDPKTAADLREAQIMIEQFALASGPHMINMNQAGNGILLIAFARVSFQWPEGRAAVIMMGKITHRLIPMLPAPPRYGLSRPATRSSERLRKLVGDQGKWLPVDQIYRCAR